MLLSADTHGTYSLSCLRYGVRLRATSSDNMPLLYVNQTTASVKIHRVEPEHYSKQMALMEITTKYTEMHVTTSDLLSK